MTYYLITCGVVLNCMVLVVLSLLLWVMLILPALEAVSLTRMSRTIARMKGVKTKVWLFWWIYFKDRVGGRGGTYRGTSWGVRWQWNGIRDWKVYNSELP